MARNLDQAVALIKSFEGYHDGDKTTANSDPEMCPAGVWTIGWGHAVLDEHRKQIKGKENEQAAREMYPNGVTMAEADNLLLEDIERFVKGVEKFVTVDISDAQFCALVSFTYNVGLGAFKASTLLQVINDGRFDQAPEQFRRWNRGGGKVLAGLVRRREAESKLWMEA